MTFADIENRHSSSQKTSRDLIVHLRDEMTSDEENIGNIIWVLLIVEDSSSIPSILGVSTV